jgi:hypothetical protein
VIGNEKNVKLRNFYPVALFLLRIGERLPSLFSVVENVSPARVTQRSARI